MSGAVMSTTVTIAWHVADKIPSLTVRATDVCPNGNGPVGAKVYVKDAFSESDEPLSMAAAKTSAVQLVEAGTVTFLHKATRLGFWFWHGPGNITSRATNVVSPTLSVAVKVSVKFEAAVGVQLIIAVADKGS